MSKGFPLGEELRQQIFEGTGLGDQIFCGAGSGKGAEDTFLLADIDLGGGLARSSSVATAGLGAVRYEGKWERQDWTGSSQKGGGVRAVNKVGGPSTCTAVTRAKITVASMTTDAAPVPCN